MMPLILAAEQKEKQARHEEDTNTTVSDMESMHLTPVTTRASTPISAIPWYDKSYMLIKKGTLKAITLTNDGVRLQDCADGPTPANTWVCVSKSNHIGFLNTDAQVYLGHDGSKEGPSEVHAQAGRMLQFESFITRHHPEGGYQLLSVVDKMLWIVFAASDDKVMRARHGNTLWVFEEVRDRKSREPK